MKVLVLCHPTLIPPKKYRAADLVKIDEKVLKTKFENSHWRTEGFVMHALKSVGHQVMFCGVENSLKPLKLAIKKQTPDVIFNLLEEFSGEALLEPFVVAYLETIKIPFTGCGSIGLILAKNKIAAKAILRVAHVQVPGQKSYPMIVKLIAEESSRGINEKSVVKDKKARLRQLKILTRKYQLPAYFEEYILGREFHVGIMPDRSVTPIWETTFGRKPGARMLTEKSKWDFTYRKKVGIDFSPAQELSKHLASKIKKAALRSYRALAIEGSARVDIRLDINNNIYIIEVNPNPDLARFDEFAACATGLGYSYEQIIELHLKSAIARSCKPMPRRRSRRLKM